MARHSHNREFRFELSAARLKRRHLDAGEKEAKLCVYVSGMSVATTKLYCMPSPFKARIDMIEMKFDFDAIKRKAQEKSARRWDSPKTVQPKFAKNAGETIAIRGQISPHGEYKVSLGMDEFEPNSAWMYAFLALPEKKL